jgi:hypothetical protein
MSLLEELRLPCRDYWLVCTSPDGNSRHPDLKIIKVAKGANIPEIEECCAKMERQMIAALEAP